MPALPVPNDEIRAFCRSHPIQRLALFGSALNGKFASTSDVDLLVEFLPNARVGLLGMAQMEIELSQIIGRKVDLRTPEDLSRYFRDEVVDSAQVIYDRT